MTIPQPSKNSEGKLNDFYPLQPAELKALRKAKLINNAAYVHLALRCENPFCDRPIELVPKEFAIRWEIPESSVYEAISRLKATGAIVIKSGHLTIQWTSHTLEDDSNCRESFSELGEFSNPSEAILESQKEFPISKEDSKTLEKRSLKSPRGKGFSNSQKIQTYSDFQDSLPSQTRESFDVFCRRKVEECGLKIASLRCWLNKHWAEYWDEFSRKYPHTLNSKPAIQGGPQKEKLAQSPFTLAQIKASYGAYWQEAAQHFGLLEVVQ